MNESDCNAVTYSGRFQHLFQCIDFEYLEVFDSTDCTCESGLREHAMVLQTYSKF